MFFLTYSYKSKSAADLPVNWVKACTQFDTRQEAEKRASEVLSPEWTPTHNTVIKNVVVWTASVGEWLQVKPSPLIRTIVYSSECTHDDDTACRKC